MNYQELLNIKVAKRENEEPSAADKARFHTGKALQRGAHEAAWLGLAGVSLAGKGGVVAKHVGERLKDKESKFHQPLRNKYRKKLVKKLAPYTEKSTLGAAKKGISQVGAAFKRMPTKQKALVAGLGMLPGVGSYIFKPDEYPSKKACDIIKEAQSRGLI